MNESILLVEDDQEIHEMVANHLRKEGYKVASAFDGDEAIHLFTRGEFDLVMLDLMLPTANGLDILQLIRKDSMLPILIMSAKGSDLDKALGLGFGADDYVSYRYYKTRKTIAEDLPYITKKLNHIIDQQSAECLLVMTDEKPLREL